MDPKDSETPAAPTPEVPTTQPVPAPVDQEPVGMPGAPERPTEAATPAPTTSMDMTSKKGLLAKFGARLPILAGAVAAVLLIGGGSAAAYYGVILPNKPESVVKSAMANLFSEKYTSASFDGELSMKSKSKDDELSQLGISGISFDGSLNRSGVMNFGLQVNSALAKPRLDIRATDSKTFYASLSGLDGIDTLLAQSGSQYASLAPLITQLNGQWYEFTSELLNMLPASEQLSSATQPLSKEDTAKIVEAYEKNQFMVVKSKEADEKISGVDSYHFIISPDNAKMVSFMRALQALNLTQLKLTNDDITAFEKDINKVDWSKYPLELWVDKSRKVPMQLKLSGEDKDVSGALRLTIKEYNLDVKAEKPEDAKSVLELLSSFQSGAESGIDSLMETMPAGADIDPSLLDTDTSAM